jgi:methylenetetrahydrofolate reductase (NADPH)
VAYRRSIAVIRDINFGAPPAARTIIASFDNASYLAMQERPRVGMTSPLSSLGASVTSAPASLEGLKSRVVELMRQASTEITVGDDALLPRLAALLPAGSCVHVAHTPRATLDQVVHLSLAVQQFGLCACPHIVARRIASRSALRSALRELKRGGVEQILLVAGDLDQSLGAFSSTLEILDSGATVEAGIRSIGVAGHPEGHRAIGPEALWRALAQKQAFAERTGTAVHIVSQFSFNLGAVYDWERELGQHAIWLPVLVGIVGPTPLIKLLQYAVRCGVGTSLRAAAHALSAAGEVSRLATTPDLHLIALARALNAGTARQLTAPHLFAFGGVTKTAQWLRRLVDGQFEIDAEHDRLLMAG